MTTSEYQALAVRFYIFALAVFGLMQVLSLASGGAGAQEGFEFYAEPGDYHARLIAAGNALRLMLMFDFLFIIGYSAAIGLTGPGKIVLTFTRQIPIVETCRGASGCANLSSRV